MTKNIFLGLGSNKGNRKYYLNEAISHLSLKTNVVKKSSIYQTPPWGYLAQQPFLNQVIKLESDFSPESLLKFCKKLEREIGRLPTFRYGPREIDIDILAFDDLIMETENLEIPHPELHNRAFMLIPLQEVEPKFKHPSLNLSIEDMLDGKEISEIQIYQSQIQETNAKP